MIMIEFDVFDEIDGFDEGRSTINFKPFLEIVLKNWKKLLIWAFCGALFGIMIGFSTPKEYTVKAVVAPEIATRSTLSSGVSSLASLAGVNMNSLALTDAMHPDLYPEVISSTDFYISLFDMPVTIEQKDSIIVTDLYDYMANYQRQPWWSYVIGVPRMAIEGVKSWFAAADEDFEGIEGHSTIDSLRLTRQQEMVVAALKKNIEATIERKTYVLSLKVTMQDRIVAANLANAIIRNLQAFVVRYRTEKSRENVEYYEKIYADTHEEYLSAQRAYAYYADSHQGVTTLSSKIKLQHLQNESQLRYQIYNQTAQNLLAAKAKVQQESPVLVILQSGWAPTNGKPSKVKLAIAWFVLGALIGAVIVLLKKRD